MSLYVLKFGGTSVGSAASLAQVAEIVSRGARQHPLVVVVSAASGVTDTLARAASALDGTGADPDPWVAQVHARYDRLATETLSDTSRRRYAVDLRVHTEALRRTLAALAQRPSPALRDAVLATGERLSVPLVAAVLREAGLDALPADAAPLIATDAQHGDARVDQEETDRAIRQWHRGLRPGAVPVVTGFIGRAPSGAVTTLGRGGSDYTAGLIAGALRADCLERWTDIDALYTADPRRDPTARRLRSLPMAEAVRLARQGRLGIHARALDPLQSGRTTVRVRPTSDPDAPGTWVVRDAPPALPIPALA
ncbi:MAG: aspartate kinase [Bacteroidota bacterium]